MQKLLEVTVGVIRRRKLREFFVEGDKAGAIKLQRIGGRESAVEDIIVKAIAHDPADRYQNGEAVAADLRAAARSLPDEDITQFESQRNVKSLVTRLEAEEPAEPSNMGSDMPFPGTSDRFVLLFRKP